MPLPKIKRLRWWIIGLLMLGSIVNYLTRSSLGVAAPRLKEDLGISEQQYSWILDCFQGTIMLQPVCGYILDAVGLKIGFAIFAIAWSRHLHGARAGPQLASLRGLARVARLRGRLRQSRRHESHGGMVSRAGTRIGRRYFQHRRVRRFHARAAARRVGDQIL